MRSTLHSLGRNRSIDSSFSDSKLSESECFGNARKKLHRSAHISEIYRPRCYTNPETGIPHEGKQYSVPILTVSEYLMPTTPPIKQRKQHVRRSSAASALGLLLGHTLKVTTAPMGLKTSSEERLTHHPSKQLNEDDKRKLSRSTSSVSTLAYAASNSSMAPLQNHNETQSATFLNTLETNKTSPTNQQTQTKRPFFKQLSTSAVGTPQIHANTTSANENNQNFSTFGHNKSELRTAKQNSGSLNPLVSEASTSSIRSFSPLRKSGSGTTAKHELSTAAAAATTAVAAPSGKEKKRKEVSSSRVKKFHRHFTQVSKDEKLINYFSCALVSDILLQGHLYITDQHFAFYSNVFGYVTKVVIPTSSVTKISKEKTAKIIPNAVGVATADERHVFGSFISREAAFRLMCSVCSPLVPAELISKTPADIEISEELSIEDDSSCSISGNESANIAAVLGATAETNDNDDQQLLRRTPASSSLNVVGSAKIATADNSRHSDIPTYAKTATSTASCATPQTSELHGTAANPSTPTIYASANLAMLVTGTASSSNSASTSPTPSTSSSPTTVLVAKPKTSAQLVVDSFRELTKNAMQRLKFPTELHVIYLGVVLSVVLALFSVFLLYRILDIEAKAGIYHSSVDFNWRAGNDEDIFAEALRWQKELQTKSTEEAQSILNTNLEQIAKVRRSLETLSMLIHDRSSAYEAPTNRNDSD